MSGVNTPQGLFQTFERGWWKLYDPWESPFKRQGCFAKSADHQQCMRNLQQPSQKLGLLFMVNGHS